MNEDNRKKLEQLKEYDKKFIEIASKITAAYGGAVYTIDMVVVGILKRSLSLLDGFCQMLENQNNLCAASLVRLHLDSLLRFHALHLVDDPHKLARDILKGDRLDKIKDKNNNQLRDKYLAEKVNEKYNWVLSVYNATSGFVHLSDKQYFCAVTEVNDSDRSVSWAISAKDNHLREETISEYIEGFKAISDAILDYLLGWYISKDHPELLRKDKE